MKILVTSDCEICPEAMDPLREVGEVAYRHPPDPEQVREELGEYTGWLCHTQFRVHILEANGESYRLRDAKRRQKRKPPEN